MAHKPARSFVSKKNNGLEVNIELLYQSHAEVSTVNKIRVEEWLRKETIRLLTAFKISFPEI